MAGADASASHGGDLASRPQGQGAIARSVLQEGAPSGRSAPAELVPRLPVNPAEIGAIK